MNKEGTSLPRAMRLARIVVVMASCGCSSSAGGGPQDSGTTDGAVVANGSCATGGPGRTNCGPSGAAESCCTSLSVSGGTFDRTYAYADAGAATGLGDPATLNGYRLDKYEVTVGRFRQFVAGGGAPPAPGSGKHAYLNGGGGLAAAGAPGTYETGWDPSWNSSLAPDGWDKDLACNQGYFTWTPAAGTGENRPINCVNWYEAYAFCIWDGGFLPSAAELEYAWAGGEQQRKYPWGDTDPGTQSQYAIYGCYYPSGSRSCSGVADIAPVGTATLGAGRWGQLDLAGNVWEWTLDWHATAEIDPCVDCANLAPGSDRAMQGGSFVYPVLEAGGLSDSAPSARSSATGVRCARAP